MIFDLFQFDVSLCRFFFTCIVNGVQWNLLCLRCTAFIGNRLNTVLSYFNSLNPTHAVLALPRFSLNELTNESYGESTNELLVELLVELPDELFNESSLFFAKWLSRSLLVS